MTNISEITENILAGGSIRDAIMGSEVEELEEENLPYKLNFAKYGFQHQKSEDFSDDGNVFYGYRYRGNGPLLTRLVRSGRDGVSQTGEYISLRIEDWKAGDKYNGAIFFKTQQEADEALRYLSDLAKKEYAKIAPETELKPGDVEIIKDKGKLRGVADDGEHGLGFVNMPRLYRDKEGTRLKALDLKWNGKNYVARKFTLPNGDPIDVEISVSRADN